MKKTLFAGITLSIFAVSAHAGGLNVQPDKVEHFLGSYAMAMTVAPLVDDTAHPVLYSFGIGMVPGLVKRAMDERGNYSPREKNQDMIANITGALSGAVIGHGVMVFVNEGRQHDREVGVKFSMNF